MICCEKKLKLLYLRCVARDGFKTSMQKTIGIIIACGLVAFAGNSRAQTPSAAKSVPAAKPAPAAQLVGAAQKRAGKEHKAVLVMFHASWCGWCHRLTDMMDKPQYKKLFADNYVVVSLDVSENGEKKALENPGAVKVMADLGGGLSGLPFYAFVSSKGKQLGNSNAVPSPSGILQNIGYPSAPQEIAAFDELLKKTAPKMDVKARESLIAYLTESSPQRNNGGGAAH